MYKVINTKSTREIRLENIFSQKIFRLKSYDMLQKLITNTCIIQSSALCRMKYGVTYIIKTILKNEVKYEGQHSR